MTAIIAFLISTVGTLLVLAFLARKNPPINWDNKYPFGVELPEDKDDLNI